jgi:hypothetical protein
MPNGTRMISAQCIARVRQQAELQDPIGIVRRAAYVMKWGNAHGAKGVGHRR